MKSVIGEEYIISQKLNVCMIADHLAFHGQLCYPEDTEISIVHNCQIMNLFSGYHFPFLDSIICFTQVSTPSRERVR